MRKMKDSGIKWIGDIPEYWKIIKLKNILVRNKNAIRVGPFGSQLKSTDFVNDGHPVYNQRTVLDNNFNNNTIFIIQ